MRDQHPDPQPDHQPRNFTEFTRGTFYKSRRVKEHERWMEQLKPMFIAYLGCLGKTSDWGDQGKWDQNWNTPCSCPLHRKKVREVDVVDLLSRGKLKIAFCNCLPDQVRLIRLGYIGSSPTQPSTAFSIRLLRFYQSLWKFCCLRVQPFCLALDMFLDAHCPLILVKGTNRVRLWRRTFTAALDAYRHMLRLYEELTAKALDLSALDKLAWNCPRCYGPEPPTENEPLNPPPNETNNVEAEPAPIESPNDFEPDYIVSVDGNFQHRRHLTASKEYEEITFRTPSLFVDPGIVKRWEGTMLQNGRQNFPLVRQLILDFQLFHLYN
ncbi:hypothetical protein DFH28DRAFT_884096 [Melampsora americana]|nr:hypothetical protein DFH28DRAFT_884096 [Melampsora americana]